MKHQLISGFILSLVFCSFLLTTGCIEEGFGETTIIGFWQDQDTSYNSFEFFEDGTCLINERVEGTYTIEEFEFEDSQLVIKTPHDGHTYHYHFSIARQGSKMVLREINEGNVYSLRKE